MSGRGKIISGAEVAKHNKENDLWIALHGKVYDCSKFVVEHPGGIDNLVDVAGTDASDEFDAVGHSVVAKDTLKKLLVGELSQEGIDHLKKEKKLKAKKQGWNLPYVELTVLLVLGIVIYNIVVK